MGKGGARGGKKTGSFKLTSLGCCYSAFSPGILTILLRAVFLSVIKSQL